MKAKAPVPLPDALVEAYATNDRITRYLVESLDPRAWRAEPPGGRGRTIAAIVAHIHNVRLMWLKVAAKGSRLPAGLDRDKVTPRQALGALKASGEAIAALLRSSLAGEGRIKGFRPDAAGFVGYCVSHDAHHRGQISQLARQVGHPVSQKVMFGMWEWGKR